MTRQAVVVNCSSPRYNLGAHKLADWLRCEGWAATLYDGDPGLLALGADLVCLSVIFSWDAPMARDIALRMKGHADVWAGGPGLFALGDWWQRETGLSATRGLDRRFEQQRGDYAVTFASRGCPRGCWWCIVPKAEGLDMALDWDFRPAPILADSNLSALPVDFQEHVIGRYRSAGVPLVDANSGFDPASFDGATYERWRPILRGPWRLGFDTGDEAAEVGAMMRLLAAEPAYRKRVYVLIGNEPIEACYRRALQVIEWGGEPVVQMFRPLNWLGGLPPAVRFDWTWQQGKDLARYFNRYIWRQCPIADYRPRRGERPPFEVLGMSHAVKRPAGDLIAKTWRSRRGLGKPGQASLL